MPGVFRIVAAVLVAGTIAAAAPEPSPSPPLPDIGRTRSVRLPCAVVRDLVAPAVAAALDATVAFDAAKVNLRRYGIVTGGIHTSAAAQIRGLMLLDRNKTVLAKNVLTISRMLGDPRVAATQSDPATKELRQALQTLYDAENAKLNALSAFIEAEYVGQLLNENELISQMSKATAAGNGAGLPGSGGVRSDAPRALATPVSFAPPTQQPAAAINRRNPQSDVTFAPAAPERRVTSDAGDVLAKEAQASKTIQAIAETCR